MPRKAKRQYGDGSIYKDHTRNRWVGRIYLGSQDGKPVMKQVVGKNRNDVERKLNGVLASKPTDQADDAPLPREFTVSTWLDHWFAHILPNQGLRDSTVEGYVRVADIYIKPNVGSIFLADLKASDVDKMMAKMRREGLSANTIRHARTVLRRALTIAVRRRSESGLTTNVVTETDGPKIERGTKLDDALTAEEAKIVLKTVKGDDLEALAHFLLILGSRKTETITLRWTDINLKAATVSFRSDTTKNDQSAATIALPSTLVEILREHKARQAEHGPSWNPGNYVFTTSTGTPLDRSNALHWWYRLTKRAGIGRRRMHAARHTAATLMLNNEVPLEVVQKTLRHKSIRITADVYAKVGEDLQRTAATAMENVLYGDEPPETPLEVD